MNDVAEIASMTGEELLAIPEDGIRRWLIDGELQEKPRTIRNRVHSRIMARVAKFLDNWLDGQPEPRGQILCGEAGVRLRRNPDTVVGMDVVYVPPDVVARQTGETTLIDGVPTLAVEILSPNDTVEETDAMVDGYLSAGVRLVWVIHPHRRTVQIYRPGTEPEMVNAQQELTADPELPGFRVAVVQLFG